MADNVDYVVQLEVGMAKGLHVCPGRIERAILESNGVGKDGKIWLGLG